MTREEHLEWAKARALEYLKSGDLTSAVSSILSDLPKHDEFEAVNPFLAFEGMQGAANGDIDRVHRFIVGFR